MKGATYGELDAVLRSFGLHVRDVDGDTRIYTYPGTNALLTVPVMPDAEPASNFHILGARMTVDAAGLGSPDEFTARLVRAAGPAPASHA